MPSSVHVQFPQALFVLVVFGSSLHQLRDESTACRPALLTCRCSGPQLQPFAAVEADSRPAWSRLHSKLSSTD